MTSSQRTAERSLHNQMNILPKKELILVFSSLAIAQLVSFIDQNGIGVTLPIIARDLHAENTISWAGTSSLIANTTFQMLYGRLSDIFGRRVVLLAAILCLTTATLLCGFSKNATMFYVFRGFAGIGGGGVANLTTIIVSDIVTLEQRGYFQGIIGSCVGLGNIIGPFLAAAFITHASWRAFFWTTAPLAAIAGAISFYMLPSMPPMLRFKDNVKKIDYGGVLLSSIGIIFLSVPISGIGAYFSSTSSMTISMLVIGATSLALFILWEWKVARLPMIPMQIFSPVVCILLGQNFLLGGVYQTYLYYLLLYLQNVRGYSVLRSAGAIAVMVGVQAVFSSLSGLYITYFKRWKEVLCTGFSLWTLGAGLLLLYKRDTSLGSIIGPLVILGVGIGCTFQPTIIALQAHVTQSRRAVIISNRNFFRCAGGATGLALSAATLQTSLKRSLPANYLANNAYTPPKIQGPGSNAVLDAYTAASRAVFILQLPLIVVCLLGCLFLKEHGLKFLEEDDGEGCEEPGDNNHDSRSTQKTAVTPISSQVIMGQLAASENTSRPCEA
ncbi:major facilitator superfamily domain-containing protein [Xylaria grammica]|nr:major facilitator superfamily domain-containing protein [Xylaria grammica]